MENINLELLATHALNTKFILNKEMALPQDEENRKMPQGTSLIINQVILAPSEVPYDPFEVWVAVQFDSPGNDHPQYHEWTYPLEFLTNDCEELNPI